MSPSARGSRCHRDRPRRKIDSQVHVGHNVRIGKNVVIAAQTGISGSVVIEDNVVIAGQVGIADHVRIPRAPSWARSAAYPATR